MKHCIPSFVVAFIAAPLLGSCASRTNATEPDGVLAHLAHPDAVEIYALHPYPHQFEDPAASHELFHDYPVLGRATLATGAEGDELLALVEHGIESSEGMVAACFNPRHGISVLKNGVRFDYVICYECLSMSVYRDDVSVEPQLTTEDPSAAVTALFGRNGLAIHGDEE